MEFVVDQWSYKIFWTHLGLSQDNFAAISNGQDLTRKMEGRSLKKSSGQENTTLEETRKKFELVQKDNVQMLSLAKMRD